MRNGISAAEWNDFIYHIPPINVHFFDSDTPWRSVVPVSELFAKNTIQKFLQDPTLCPIIYWNMIINVYIIKDDW